MEFITVIDFFLLFPYLAIFFFFARRFARKIESPEMRKHFMVAFWLRMFGCIAYSMVIVFYYGYGDSLSFYQGSHFITSGILDSPDNIRYLFAPLKDISAWYNASPGKDDIFAQYFAQPSGNLVMKISAALSFLSFNRFLIISLFFAFFSTLGQWRLFTVFDNVNKHRNRKILALAILYTPSIWFWGSGLMKDSLCLGGFCYLVYFAYQGFAKKHFPLKYVIASLLLVYMIFTIKIYIIAMGALALFFTVAFVFLKQIQNIVMRSGAIILLLLISAIIFNELDIGSLINAGIADAVAQIKVFQGMYESVGNDTEDSRGAFSIGEIVPTPLGILQQAPKVLMGCLYRPYLWEARKVVILFTSLESTFLLFVTIYLLIKTKIFGFFKIIFSNEYIFFCFTLSILFALVIGFTTFNFGTMIRYKIIFLPFLYFMFAHIYGIVKEKNKKPPVAKPQTPEPPAAIVL